MEKYRQPIPKIACFFKPARSFGARLKLFGAILAVISSAANQCPGQSPSASEVPTAVNKGDLSEAYPVDSVVHITWLSPNPIISQPLPDGNDVCTYSGGVYVYQRPAGKDLLLEFRAENIAVFYSQQKIFDPNSPPVSATRLWAPGLLGEIIYGIYLEGDVVFEAGYHKITADQLYYDFTQSRAVVVDAAMRIGLPDPTQPFYLRAQRLRQLSVNRFQAEKVKLSTDEFYEPHVWLGAQKASLTAMNEAGEVPDNLDEARRFHYELSSVSANVEGVPIFYWPFAAGDSTKFRLPVKSVHTSYGSQYGFSLESEWHLAWFLGLEEPPGTESILRVDEFSERGPATGIELDYQQEHMFGNLRSYLIDDEGQDRLGRFPARYDVTPERTLRGRARWQHRQFFPLDWQGTFEISYLSDPTFLESWEEKEFDTDKEQETVVYFKQQRDNWAFDFLSKWQLNDFDYTMTELPKAGFHLAGQDFFELFTYYHDGFISRLGQRAGEREVPGLSGKLEPWDLPGTIDQNDFAFGVSRHVLALPLHAAGLHIVPTVIGTYVYDDTAIENSFVQGAAGVRASTQFWHVDDKVKSRFWDLDCVRHIIIPEVSAFWVDSGPTETNPHDVFNFALRQRFQTKRGPEGKKRSVDFFRLNTDVTLVERDVEGSLLPNKFFFSSPEPQFGETPLLNPDFSNLGLARRETINQTLSDFATADWTWLISDTTALTGSFNYNIHEGLISQAHAALAVQRFDRMSYYVGDLFINHADTFRADNSHFLTGGLSYRLNRKYTVALAQQFDVERSLDSYSQIVIIREFAHWYGAFSFSLDPARDSVGFSVSFWPEGFDKFALGSRRFTRLTP